ncbi:hypothetical protein AB7M17_007329 [Bradyrhizobium sp. USDA 377]
MTEAESVSITPRASSPKIREANQFATLGEAEAFLQSAGFHLVPDSCNWTNAEGDDAGVYAVDGRYGAVKAWRVRINRSGAGGAVESAEAPSRRRFLSRAAGVAAGGSVLALAAIPPAATTAAPAGKLGASALALDATKISPQLRDLVHALQDADDALTPAMAAFDAEYERYQEWLKRHPAPSGKNRRAMHKWDRRQQKYIEGSNFLAAQAAQVEAVRAHEAARKVIAEYRARDMNELIHMACLVCVFEDGKHGRSRVFMAQGVAYDLARFGTGGGIS